MSRCRCILKATRDFVGLRGTDTSSSSATSDSLTLTNASCATKFAMCGRYALALVSDSVTQSLGPADPHSDHLRCERCFERMTCRRKTCPTRRVVMRPDRAIISPPDIMGSYIVLRLLTGAPGPDAMVQWMKTRDRPTTAPPQLQRSRTMPSAISCSLCNGGSCHSGQSAAQNTPIG